MPATPDSEGTLRASPPADPSRGPVAATRAHEHRSPFGVRSDPYHWLRDDTRSNKEVLGHLQAENEHTAAAMAASAGLQEKLYGEIVARIKQDDSTVPVLDRGYWYYSRYETGKQYPIYCRRRDKNGAMDGAEQVLLDGNERAKGHSYYRAGGFKVSKSGRLLAFGEDLVGRFQFRLQVRDLETGAFLPDVAENISANLEWGEDDRTIYYVAKDPTTLRSHRVHRHQVGTPADRDELVYEEKDTAYYTAIFKTKSREFLAIHLSSTLTSEVRFLDLRRPAAPVRVFLPREHDHEYDADHLNGRWVVRTNWKAKNFRLMEVAEAKHADRSAWRDMVPHREDALVEEFALYRDFVSVGERSGGLRKVQVLPARGKPFLVDGDEPSYTMIPLDTPEANSTLLRYLYTSLTTPMSTYELDVSTGKRVLLKRTPVLGDFDPAGYVTEYLHATARDGTPVPVSVVHRKGLPRDGSAPLLVYGYGSYGSSSEPTFSSDRLSLLDRGFVFAMAHVRGGQEMGRRWYEGGKLLTKKNSFTDFIEVTEFLLAQKLAARDKVFAVGGSAGGLLVGAVANMRPDLYRGIIAHVPFVDVVTTMLDDTIPLTSNEFDEWGDPKKKEFYDYMLSYSPYDNVRAQAYPSMLVTTGLHDSQVQYWEAAKWVARLRATRTDRNLLLLQTNMSAGHGGKSGRYEKYRETARDYAFLLHVLERPDRRPTVRAAR
ncbi:MAG TPA: S9 family peptidase [Kofleriaceae bacterium]|nr:S9 family peptidase [Kofleriaceae bacterium]